MGAILVIPDFLEEHEVKLASGEQYTKVTRQVLPSAVLPPGLEEWEEGWEVAGQTCRLGVCCAELICLATSWRPGAVWRVGCWLVGRWRPAIWSRLTGLASTPMFHDASFADHPLPIAARGGPRLGPGEARETGDVSQVEATTWDTRSKQHGSNKRLCDTNRSKHQEPRR